MTPTGQPMGTPMPSAPSAAAQQAVNLPSIFLMVMGALGALIYAWSLLQSLTGSSAASMAMMQERLAALPPDQQEAVRPLMNIASSMQGGSGIAFSVFCMAMGGLVVFAGLQMRALKNWGLALAGAILVMTPCSSYCCCCIGLPVGVWALIVLMKPEVKSAFS